MVQASGWACSLNCSRVMGHTVFTATGRSSKLWGVKSTPQNAASLRRIGHLHYRFKGFQSQVGPDLIERRALAGPSALGGREGRSRLDVVGHDVEAEVAEPAGGEQELL